jgi:hypothetical protein
MIVEHELYIFRDTDCIVYSFTIDENDWQVLTTEVPEALNSIIELSKQCTAYNHEDRPESDAVATCVVGPGGGGGGALHAGERRGRVPSAATTTAGSRSLH